MNLTREETIAWLLSNFESRLWRTANEDYHLRMLSRYEVEAVKAALQASRTEADANVAELQRIFREERVKQVYHDNYDDQSRQVPIATWDITFTDATVKKLSGPL